MKAQVINESLAVTTTKASYLDGTSKTLHDYFNFGNFNRNLFVAANAVGSQSDYMEVIPMWEYKANITTQFIFFDSTKTQLTTSSGVSAKAPATAKYLKVNIYGDKNTLVVVKGNYNPSFAVDVLNYEKSKWNGKTWWVLGDSITYGTNETANPYAKKPYHYLIAEKKNITVQNDAISGYTIQQMYNNKVVNMPDTANAPDLITIMIGTNNHGFNLAIGAITDTPSTDTFYATYKKVIEEFTVKYPNTHIGLITPIKRYFDGVDIYGEISKGGSKLVDYRNAVLEIGRFYSLPVCDLYYNIGFTPHNSTQNSLYFCNADGTHPNDLGHERIERIVNKWIETI